MPKTVYFTATEDPALETVNVLASGDNTFPTWIQSLTWDPAFKTVLASGASLPQCKSVIVAGWVNPGYLGLASDTNTLASNTVHTASGS